MLCIMKLNQRTLLYHNSCLILVQDVTPKQKLAHLSTSLVTLRMDSTFGIYKRRIHKWYHKIIFIMQVKTDGWMKFGFIVYIRECERMLCDSATCEYIFVSIKNETLTPLILYFIRHLVVYAFIYHAALVPKFLLDVCTRCS